MELCSAQASFAAVPKRTAALESAGERVDALQESIEYIVADWSRPASPRSCGGAGQRAGLGADNAFATRTSFGVTLILAGKQTWFYQLQ